MPGGGRKPEDEAPKPAPPESEDSVVFEWLPLDNEPPAPPPPPLATTPAKLPETRAQPVPPPAPPAKPEAPPPSESALWSLPALPGFDADEPPAVPPHRIVPMPPPVAKSGAPTPAAPRPAAGALKPPPAAPKPAPTPADAPSPAPQAAAAAPKDAPSEPASAHGDLPLIYPPSYRPPPAPAQPRPPALARPHTPAAAPAPPRAQPAPPRAQPAPRLGQGRRAARFSLPVIPLLAVAGLLIAGAAAFVLLRAKPPSVSSATPVRVRAGQTLTIRGENFGARPQDNDVRFDGKPGRVLRAAADELQVEVPATIPTAAGRDTQVSVSVRSHGRAAEPLSVSAFQAPAIRSLTPDVGMPGDEIVVAGGGWGTKVEVRFAGTKADLLEVTPESVRAKVPQVSGAPGTPLEVVASSGAERSEPAAFLLGHLPLLLSIEPANAAPGDVVTLKGKGFDPRPAENLVSVAGARALVLKSAEATLEVVVPIPPPGSAGAAAVEVRVPGSSFAGSGSLGVSGGAAAQVPFRFVALPFTDAPGHDHALVATELGPAFVLSASGGRTAAERALETQRRLNESSIPLSTPEEPPLELREADGALTIGLQASATPLLEVTQEDAAAYNEGSAPFRGNAGRAVTRGRLAAWWLALLRDTAAMLGSDRRPRHVALLTAEAKALSELHAGARRRAGSGVARSALAELRPESHKGLQALALRVPPAVSESGDKAAEGTAAGARAADDPLQLDGQWSGTATEDGISRPVQVSFADGAGTLTYLKPLLVTVPLREVTRPRLGSVRFAVQTGTRTRYFLGIWDGEMLSGPISSTADGQSPVGRFELRH